MPTIPPAKQTKAELLATFEALKAEHESLQKNRVTTPQIKQEEQIRQGELRLAAAKYTPETVEHDGRVFQEKVLATLETLRADFRSETTRLAEVRLALTAETAQLETTRHIQIAFDTLDVLLAEYDQKKKALAEDDARSREELMLAMDRQKKAWQREKEDYEYTLKLNRQKEVDTYETEKEKQRAAWQEEMSAKENQLALRTAAIKEQETEWQRLQKETAQFPDRLAKATTEATASVTAMLEKDFAVEKRLLEQERKAEEQLLRAQVKSLEETIRVQSQETISLKAALAEATKQSQQLATTVIENVSRGAQRSEVPSQPRPASGGVN